MKELLKRIRRILCRHNERVYDIILYAKPKYKRVKKGHFKLRYDIYEEKTCYKCGKFLEKRKLRSDLTEVEAKLYLEQF